MVSSTIISFFAPRVPKRRVSSPELDTTVASKRQKLDANATKGGWQDNVENTHPGLEAILTPDASKASSSDPSVFSDLAFHVSSPPSSPPGFPWEKQGSRKGDPRPLATASESALSSLSERMPLASASHTTRPVRKVAAKKETLPGTKLTQLQISLGQTIQKTCKTCGMSYVASDADDRKLHAKYHKQSLEGLDVGKTWLKQARTDALWMNDNGEDIILSVTAKSSKPARDRAKAVLDLVQKELGAVQIAETELWRTSLLTSASSTLNQLLVLFEFFLFVRGTKCIGLLLAERIERGYQVLEPAPARNPDRPPSTSTVERLRAQREYLAKAHPIQLSKDPSPAVLGISRIWTSSTSRKQHVAKTLLDNAARSFGIGTDAKEQIAFSQPTEAGTALARKWIGRRYGWLVYVD